MQKRNRTTAAYATFITSMLIVGTVGIFRRLIPLSSALLAFSRGIIGGVFLILFILVKRRGKWERIPKKKLLLLLLNGAMIGVNWMLLFEAYNYTTIATATLCYYLQPTIILLLSPLVFHERLTAKKLLCAAAALCGMVFVSGVLSAGGAQAGDIKGILFAVASAFLYAVVVMSNKKTEGVGVYEKTMIQLLSAAIVLIPYLLLTEDLSAVTLDKTGVVMLLIMGVVHTGLAYVLYFGSIPDLRAQTISILGYIDPVTALAASALILHEALTLPSLIGAVLIIGSALVSEIELPQKRKKVGSIINVGVRR